MFEIDDSFINDYINESRENLADIENDLLTIESGGAAIDETLVNKVFRAAHSIKGGAGFFNLTKIQELAHRTENVLDLVRSRQMQPTPDVINILLLAFDQLREMINDHQGSQEVNISDLMVTLSGLISTHLPTAKKSSLTRTVKVTAPGVKVVFQIPEYDYNHAREGSNYLYLVEYDLIDDVQRRGKRPVDVLFILSSTGTILESVFDLDTAGTLDDEPSSRLPFYILFATELGPDSTDIIFDVPPNQVHLIHAPSGQASLAAPEVQAVAPVPVEAPRPAPPPAAPPPPPVEAAPAAPAEAAPHAAIETTLRVEVRLLEELMNLAGELVLSRNQLLEAISSDDLHSLKAGAQRINLVTSELQEAIMQTRLQPVGNIFNKFPRVVRDLARELGKEINLEIDGREVEMDKTIIEGLSEPLTHMVRNAVDHGIEMPEARAQAGKARTGTLKLQAYHEAGQVVVVVGDDGGGIDPQRVAQSAINKGLITAEQVRAMGAREKINLIFLPGLSTASRISDVSGRGVGMDVVKTNLDRLGGKIEIDSTLGKGTRFIIKLPLTLAIIPSLLVAAGGERFAVPQAHVNELIHISAEQVKKRIEVVGDAEVLILRGSMIPLVRLTDVLGITRTIYDPQHGALIPDRRVRIADRRSPHYELADEPPTPDAEAPSDRRGQGERRLQARSALNIVIITTGLLQYGLIVDEMHDTVEIVVKALGKHLKGLREYAGATILGDGAVALILDAGGIAAKQKLVSMNGSQRARQLAKEMEQEEAQNRHAFLTFRNAPAEFCAVPLDLVARVSQVSNQQIERIGGRRTMQYNGTSLPLVALQDTAQTAELQPEQDKAVIVFNIYGHEVGLLAGMPVDVVESDARVDQETLRQRGVLGSAIIDAHTTLIVDIHELVAALHPDWAENHARPATAAGAPGATILLAEDSDFFRNQVKRFLEEDGYTVLAAEDGQAAWDLLRENFGKVDMLLTDIEMPRMDGLALARLLRSSPQFATLPIIGLSSLAGEEDAARAHTAGMNDYQVKLDREHLLKGIYQLLNKFKTAAASHA